MNAFRFRLERVLKFRRTQLELEENRFRQQAAQISRLDQERAEAWAAGFHVEHDVRRWRDLAGHDLAALDRFRLAVRSRARSMAQRRVELVRRLAEQETRMVEARRRERLLERLRDRRLAAWVVARDRELEEFAGEAFLARWRRS
jgi:hypothetical protein